MYTATFKEVKKALKALPACEPQTHMDLLWWVKDFYNGDRFVNIETIHRVLERYMGTMFNSAKINNEKMFWKMEKNS